MIGVFIAGGAGPSHRREGELDGIDQDFEDTQVEVNLQGMLCSVLPCVSTLCMWIVVTYCTFFRSLTQEQSMSAHTHSVQRKHC